MEKRENRLVKLIAFGPLIFIPLLVTIIILIIINQHESDFQKTLNQLEQDLIQTESKAIKTKIESISDLITYQNEVLVNKMTHRIEGRVNDAHKIAQKIINTYQGKKSQKEIQAMIVSALRPLKWNNTESFIFILDYKGVFKLAPDYLRHKEGESIINFQDATGRYVIKEEINLVKEKKEGFLWDTFTKPNDPWNHYKQVVYVKDLGSYNWYMGSGEYLNTASKKNDKELIEAIKRVSAGSSKYIFIFNTDGQILLNQSTPQYENVNFNDIKNTSIKEAYSRGLSLMKNKKSSMIEYSWINPISNEKETKYSYIKKVPGTNWIIGTGFYKSHIKQEAGKQTIKLYEDYHTRISYIISLGIISVIFSLIISYVLSNYLKRLFKEYKHSISNKTEELEVLNKTLEEKVLKRTLQLQKSKEKLELLATTDALTHVNNRYAIMQCLESEISRTKRYQTPLCIAMFDVDHFKRVNDTYGHDRGDKVLISVTEIVKNSLRDIDSIGRYGGEEFIVIYPNTELENAALVSQRLRTNIENYTFEEINNLTISLGLVQYNQSESLEDVFKRLDKLLYKSKEEGRNRLSY